MEILNFEYRDAASYRLWLVHLWRPYESVPKAIQNSKSQNSKFSNLLPPQRSLTRTQRLDHHILSRLTDLRFWEDHHLVL